MSNIDIPMAAGDHAEKRADDRRRIFAILGASSGNLVEWFDFYVYSFCAIYFAPAFFPKGDPTTQLLNTAGVFAAGFFRQISEPFPVSGNQEEIRYAAGQKIGIHRADP